MFMPKAAGGAYAFAKLASACDSGELRSRKTSGEVKARLVTDLRRSGGNGRLKIRERVVLPRVLDLVFFALRLLEVWEDVSLLDLAAIDFTDAFHTLWLREEERPLCVFESDGI